MKHKYKQITNVYEMSEEDDKVFEAVKEFAEKWNIMIIKEAFTNIPINTYHMFHEWTDGDELTFFICCKVLDLSGKKITKEICHASVDDWEEDRPKTICDKLYKKCIEHGIIAGDGA